jgi:hypothetical protein
MSMPRSSTARSCINASKRAGSACRTYDPAVGALDEVLSVLQRGEWRRARRVPVVWPAAAAAAGAPSGCPGDRRPAATAVGNGESAAAPHPQGAGESTVQRPGRGGSARPACRPTCKPTGDPTGGAIESAAQRPRRCAAACPPCEPACEPSRGGVSAAQRPRRRGPRLGSRAPRLDDTGAVWLTSGVGDSAGLRACAEPGACRATSGGSKCSIWRSTASAGAIVRGARGRDHKAVSNGGLRSAMGDRCAAGNARR